jgi:hypothetical protein
MIMSNLIPNRFLFKFEFPIHRCAKPPAIDGRAEKWDKKWLLPALHELDGEPPTGEVWAAWNDDGLFIAARVTGKKRSPRCDPAKFRQSDNFRLMTDMRDTRNIRRATRFCQQFYFLPTGGGRRNAEPVAGTVEIARAGDDAPKIDPGQIVIASKMLDDGYSMTIHLPREVLSGFDPDQTRRIGLFYMLEDTELGSQSLTVGDDLNWWMDPSTWPTAVLAD